MDYGFLPPPHTSCGCYCAWSQVSGGQRKGKKEWRLVHFLPITAPLVKQNDSSPSLRTFAACPSPQPPLSPPRHHRRTAAHGGGGKEGKKRRTPGDSPAPSLCPLGVPLFLGSETRNFTWSSFCQPLVHTSEFLAAFGSRLGNTGGKKNGKLTAGLVEL